MIFAKDTTYGIDTTIKLIQRNLNGYLPWFDVVSDTDISIYGKIQTTIKDDKIIPEAFKSGIDYDEIFINDKESAAIGFNVISRSIENNKYLATIDIIFTVLLDEIHDNSLRNDEKALLEAYNTLQNSGNINNITGIKEGITDVFSGFDQENIKHRDMQPWYVFAITCEIEYPNDLCQ